MKTLPSSEKITIFIIALFPIFGLLSKGWVSTILFLSVLISVIYLVNSTTKCNFEQLGKEAKDVLVSKASRPASQSSHDLSTP